MTFWNRAGLSTALILTMTFGVSASPVVECQLNADSSAATVTASNLGDTSYACLASCRITVAGQRALDRFECKFSLARNASQKTVCTRDGGKPMAFTAISPTRSTCVPRN